MGTTQKNRKRHQTIPNNKRILKINRPKRSKKLFSQNKTRKQNQTRKTHQRIQKNTQRKSTRPRNRQSNQMGTLAERYTEYGGS